VSSFFHEKKPPSEKKYSVERYKEMPGRRRGGYGAFSPGGNYKANSNGYGGGNKLSGLGYNGIGVRGNLTNHLKTEANADQVHRMTIYCGTNQLGGIGVGRGIFGGSGFVPGRGPRYCTPYVFQFKRTIP
jgi:hypothetical protein